MIFYRYRREIETLQTLRDSLQLKLDNSADLLKQKEKDIKAKVLQVEEKIVIDSLLVHGCLGTVIL